MHPHGGHRTEGNPGPKNLASRATAGQLSGFREKHSASKSKQDHFEIHDGRTLGSGRHEDLSFRECFSKGAEDRRGGSAKATPVK